MVSGFAFFMGFLCMQTCVLSVSRLFSNERERKGVDLVRGEGREDLGGFEEGKP